MRGVVPKGVTLPLGAMRVIGLPACSPSRAAMPAPMMTCSPLSKLSSAWGLSLLDTVVRPARSARRSPRTTTPRLTPFWLAITSPSTTGAARVTPGTARMRAATASKSFRA